MGRVKFPLLIPVYNSEIYFTDWKCLMVVLISDYDEDIDYIRDYDQY